ncbi:hypothetical protein [Halobacteriovorax sp. HLS]|uniref:hypothetical protein n=1 Tax=Halobacteriovorax sp. HLS TaxID=2234000 RepID=UPI000FD896F4|nr:hypothetical protein [Halobacteriovorax sp. HLS]
MKSLLTLKALTGFLTATTVVVGIKGVQDANFNSNEFMNQTKVEIVQRLDDQDVVRYVASTEAARPAVQYLPINDQNSSIINGEWEVRRIQNENNEVVFEANSSEEYVPMNFNLIGTSLVKISGEEEMNFRVSYLDESGRTIALFRQFGKGYEILEAVRVVKAVEKKSEVIAQATVKEEVKESKNGVLISEVQDLVIESALHPVKDPNILRGEVVSGNIVVDTNLIEELNVVVGIGKNYEQPLSFLGGAEIKAGGQFSAETNHGEVTGIITNNGKDGFRIRFATGPLQGAMLNFVSEAKLDQMAAQLEESQLLQQEARELTSDQIEVVEEQNEAEFSRSAGVEGEQNIYEVSEEEVEEEEIVEPETEEEFARITEEVGFDFTQPKRAPASK